MKGKNRKSEQGMSLIAIMGVMAIFAMSLMVVAPTVYIEVQRERELEQIRRGEEVAEAIRQYIIAYQGRKLPNSIDDLLEGIPYGTKKRMILRPSAAIDPLSEDGKWMLVPMNKVKGFARRVQLYNNGILPSSEGLPPAISNQVGAFIVNLNTKSADDTEGAAEDTDEESFSTSNTPFIGVVSQSQNKSIISYYGIENHSKWVFTPLFRGSGASSVRQQNSFPKQQDIPDGN